MRFTYIRGCKDKGFAIEMNATIFNERHEYIISTLQTYGLLDADEQYIESVRLTGKEATMEEKKINYPTFRWSPVRKNTLAELYQDGTPVQEIAAHFKTSEEVIYKAIEKYNIVSHP